VSSSNEEIIHRLLDAFNGRDVERAVQLWSPEGEWRPAFTGGGLVEGTVYRGHAGVRDYFETQLDTWETVATEAVSIRGVGERMLVEVHLSAVGRASGIAVDRNTWNVFEIRDGRFTDGRVFATEREAIEAVGRPGPDATG